MKINLLLLIIVALFIFTACTNLFRTPCEKLEPQECADSSYCKTILEAKGPNEIPSIVGCEPKLEE